MQEMLNKTEDELYSKLSCALMHDMMTCESCKQCSGKDFIEIRMNLVKELALYMGKETPWREDDSNNIR